ncbi:MAG: hypothetical protein E5V25_07250 [Mesorhizobium sp.]|nr:MAG: hypothetical protein E5V25_07250 [Mesorhizobium sp.]
MRRETMPLVATHALLGDDEARTLMDAVAGYLGRCNGSAASPKAPLCLTCEATFGEGASPAAVVVAVPVKVGPVSVGSGVCKACAGRLSDREISEAWARSLKWPGLQITERVS